ncbi:hypothetical protein Tco_0025742 [Tanacetum coccineum]
MIDELSIVETEKVIHTMKIYKVTQIVDVESSGKSADEIDKETVSFGEMQLKQEHRSCVHASIKLHLHVVHVIPRFLAQSVGSSNTDVLDLPCLLVLITGTSQSRQHDKSESDSYYLSD